MAVVALALAALVAWQWSDGGGTAVPQSSSPPPPVPAVAPLTAGPSKLPAEQPATERTEAAVPTPTPPPRARAGEVVVHVVDADSREPVPEYGLREHVSPTPNVLARERPLLHAGSHPDGRLVMPESAFERRAFVIEDAAGRYLPSRWFAIGDAVERDGERTIEVRLPAPVDVRVKVVRERTGEAVVGTRVELMRPWIVPHPVKPQTGAAPSANFRGQHDDNALFMNFIGGRALLLGDVKTDAAGLAVLRVPPGEPLALRLTGALHHTLIVEPWQAPAEPRTDVVLTVAGGAAVRGRITPAAALARLRARLPDGLGQRQEEVALLCSTGVRFQHVGTGEVRPPGVLGREPVTLAEDGSFEMGGLAPGTWRMFFRYALNVEREASERLVLPQQVLVELPKIEGLAEGELRIVDIDVSDWVPGTLRAQLPRDDRMGKGGLGLHQIASVGPPLATQHHVASVRAVPGELIERLLPPARYLAVWWREAEADSSGTSTRTAETFVLGEVVIRPREATQIDLAIDADTTAIQVFESDGSTPMRGRLYVQRPGWYASIEIDGNGTATFEAMPRGCELKATFHRWNAAKPNGPFIDPIELGTIRTDGKPIVLRLPAR